MDPQPSSGKAAEDVVPEPAEDVNPDALFAAGEDCLIDMEYKEAATLYTKAAEEYARIGEWHKSGYAFIKLATCKSQILSRFGADHIGAAKAYSSAADIFMAAEPPDVQEATRCLEESIKMYMEIGAVKDAAECYRLQARWHTNDPTLAISIYEKAIRLFPTADNLRAIRMCRWRIAEVHAEAEEYDKAIAIFEEIWQQSLTNTSPGLRSKAEVEVYFIGVGLCLLCKYKGDVAAINAELDRYWGIDRGLYSRREYRFLRDVSNAIGQRDEFKLNALFDNYIERYGEWREILDDTVEIINQNKVDIVKNALKELIEVEGSRT